VPKLKFERNPQLGCERRNTLGKKGRMKLPAAEKKRAVRVLRPPVPVETAREETRVVFAAARATPSAARGRQR
jgi:hypothetical protein